MARWDYDNVFYRVSCVTLLAVAFSFTVILTNVFMDIDAMISKTEKRKEDVTPLVETPKTDLPEVQKPYFLPDDNSEDVYDDKDYQDSTDLYRSKRSLDSQDEMKTATDITAPNVNDNLKIAKHTNASGILKLKTEEKTMNIERMDEPALIDLNSTRTTEASTSKNIPISNIQKDSFQDITYKKIVNDYLKTLARDNNVELDKIYSRKRLKRHIKIRYENKKTTPKPNEKDDELFLEIETHFDTHGAKGEKKKEMIRELIDKIKNAIHSNKRKTHMHKNLHVKKRTQNPLDNNGPEFVNSLFPLDSLKHRQIDRISKSVPMHDKLPYVSGNKGDINWKRSYEGPGSLAKTINSAELSTVDTDYEKILKSNGIPERLQIPLNSDFSEETFYGSGIDLGNIKLLVKDIEGSGFSIGFNQFQGELPDPESIKLFTGLENVIQTYHQKFDQEDIEIPSEYDYMDLNNNVPVNNDNIGETRDVPDNVNNHVISRRSINSLNKSHHHLNGYKNIVNNKLSFKNEDNDNKNDEPSTKERTTHKSLTDPVLVLGENVFEKDFNPAEIFLMANLYDRTKRSMQVKQISNTKSKMNVIRYLNTKKISNRKMLKIKKRNKRQINKIRLVARDLSQHLPLNSEEDIFMVSDEKVFADRAVHADRAVLRGLPGVEHNKKVQTFEHYDIIAPNSLEENFKIITHPHKEFEEHIDVINPFPVDEPIYDDERNAYMRTARLNSLMARYPHIIMEEIDSREEPSFKYYRQGETPYNHLEFTTMPPKLNLSEIDLTSSAPDLSELLAPQDFGNYKVTVKIKPKNTTLNSGFKEVHTSINKSYNKNGLVYTSLVNVSEVSKVEKLNKNATVLRIDGGKNLKQQKDILKLLIRQHKLRIDEQLVHLNKEKKKLEEAFNIANDKVLPKEVLDINTLSTQSVIKNNIKLTTETSKVNRIIKNIITTMTTPKTTTEPIPTTTKDPEKIKMIKSMERNENVTNEILKKIDKNTGILETFLEKLLNSIQSVSKAQSHNPEKVDNQKNIYTTEKSELKMNNENMNVQHNAQMIPNLFFNHMQTKMNNTTFVAPYSYQNVDNKVPNVYENLVHPNTVNLEDFTKPSYHHNILEKNVRENEVQRKFFEAKPGGKVVRDYLTKNNTNFFLDD